MNISNSDKKVAGIAAAVYVTGVVLSYGTRKLTEALARKALKDSFAAAERACSNFEIPESTVTPINTEA